MPDDYSITTSTAGRLTVGGSATGTIEINGDADWFKIELQAGVTYRFDGRGAPTQSGTLLNPFLRLRDSAGLLIAFDDDTGIGLNARIDSFTATKTGSYYLSAGSAGSTGTGTYQVTAVKLSTTPVLAPEVTVLGGALGTIAHEITDGAVNSSTWDGSNFGAFLIGETALQTYTIRNDGTGVLNLSGLTVSTGFSVVEGLSSSLTAGASDTITIRMNTGSVGIKTGTLSFNSNDANEGTFNFALGGGVTNISPTLTPEVTVIGKGNNIVDGDISPTIPDGTNFGTFATGAIAEQTFTIRNDGNGVLNLSKLSVTDGFSVVNGLSSSLAAGASDTITIRMTTTTAGTKTGTLSFNSNDANEAIYNFALGGVVSGVTPPVTPTYVAARTGGDVLSNALVHVNNGEIWGKYNCTGWVFTVSMDGDSGNKFFDMGAGTPSHNGPNGNGTVLQNNIINNDPNLFKYVVPIHDWKTVNGVRTAGAAADEPNDRWTLVGADGSTNETKSDFTDFQPGDLFRGSTGTFMHAGVVAAYDKDSNTIWLIDNAGNAKGSGVEINYTQYKLGTSSTTGSHIDTAKMAIYRLDAAIINPNDTINGTARSDTLGGGAGNDIIISNEGADVVYGDDGNDSVSGGLGNDTIRGGSGNDTLIGQENNDSIMGGSGNDKIFGSQGNDTLTGDKSGSSAPDNSGIFGNDFFCFNNAGTADADKITDFSAANDTMALSIGANSVFSTGFGTNGTISAAQFYSNNGKLAHDADDRIIYNKSTGQVWYDADGTGTAYSAQLVATLNTKPTLTFNDFFVFTNTSDLPIN